MIGLESFTYSPTSRCHVIIEQSDLLQKGIKTLNKMVYDGAHDISVMLGGDVYIAIRNGNRKHSARISIWYKHPYDGPYSARHLRRMIILPRTAAECEAKISEIYAEALGRFAVVDMTYIARMMTKGKI